MVCMAERQHRTLGAVGLTAAARGAEWPHMRAVTETCVRSPCARCHLSGGANCLRMILRLQKIHVFAGDATKFGELLESLSELRVA